MRSAVSTIKVHQGHDGRRNGLHWLKQRKRPQLEVPKGAAVTMDNLDGCRYTASAYKNTASLSRTSHVRMGMFPMAVRGRDRNETCSFLLLSSPLALNPRVLPNHSKKVEWGGSVSDVPALTILTE